MAANNTTMQVHRETQYPQVRFWQECFITALMYQEVDAERAAEIADEALAQLRRRHRTDFIT